MNMPILSFILSLFLSHRLYQFSKNNNLNKWIKPLDYARYFAGFLFIVNIFLSASNIIPWVWHIFLISLLLFAVQQKEMRPLRMLLLAAAPYVAIAVLSNFAELILNDFYNRWNSYFKTANLLSIIWLIALLFSQQRQHKAAERERIKRQQEEEMNRAIAARKVELEGLVEERTAELKKQKEELEHALHDLKTTQNQLIQSEKMASLGELTAGIAHEIQNPLNFVNNFSEINSELIDELKQELENNDEKTVKEIANDIQDNEQKIMQHGQRAESIVKAMLLHSRGKTGQKVLTDINALCDEYLRLSYHGFRAKDKTFNANFTLEADKNLNKINVVPQDIGRVLLNIVNNAFQSVDQKTKEGIEGYKPEVTIRTSTSEANEVLITITDNGTGIPKNIKGKIFHPFFTTKPTGQGTGLGLSLSYDIVKAHSGTFEVDSVEGEGSEFIIKLPASL